MIMQKTNRLLLLHLNILLFSFTGIFSKLCAGSVTENGVLDERTLLYAVLMLVNCGVYAVFWQQSLKHFDVNIAYAHRSVYNIWSLLWSVVIFGEKITVGNVLGTLLIIFGILVIRGE